MANKRIVTIGYQIPGHSDWYQPFTSSQSLLDADIVVFAPEFAHYTLDYPNEFEGKPCYDQSSSFQMREHSKYWKQELTTALEEGKTIFLFFRRFESVYGHTGQKQYSGTGRNARGTKLVADFDNYQFLPIELPPMVPRSGTEVVFRGHPAFSSFWTRFKDEIEYESYLDGVVTTPLFVTKTGGKPIGALFRVGEGHLVLLPAMDYDEEVFTKQDPKKGSLWTTQAMKFGNALVAAFVEIDKALQKGGERTPPPEWVNAPGFVLQQELRIEKEIAEITGRVATLQQEREGLLSTFEEAGRLKDLLFEKGKRLEHAITSGLSILGYTAANYNDGELELDHVIESPEGDRFIGEAEGKDSSAVNIDKFRQLAGNIQEDLQRPEVQEPAIGILFGNGFRLKSPAEREEQFTDKCIKTAKSSNSVLVRTMDLFTVARHVADHGDSGFAKECRDAIKRGIGGIAHFPDTPDLKPTPSETT